MVYGDGFGARPPPIRGPIQLQPPIRAQHMMAMQGSLRAPPPIHFQPTPPSGPPPIRVPFPKSVRGTNEPDFMLFIPNPGMRPQNPK